MSAQPQHYYTPEEYLALERAAAYKSEYLAGEIFAMAGASPRHSSIAANLIRLLGNAFQGQPCRVYGSDMRVRVEETELYTYPDVVAVCGPPKFGGVHQDTLLNPTVIFEILSPSTEGYDRGKKFANYRQIPTLTDYVLVAQDEVRIEHFTRQGHGWFLTTVSALDRTLPITSIDSDLPLVAVYQNVEFTAPDATTPAL
ncbi:MAG: Uma2 family endonuclease [Chloroflexota bacterium]|nr:Uma2 family endonuclease [Chloroflexota bacterium]